MDQITQELAALAEQVIESAKTNGHESGPYVSVSRESLNLLEDFIVNNLGE